MLSRREWMQLAAPLTLSRAQAQVTPDLVVFRPEMEPLVRLIENTPRAGCAAMAVDQMRRGVSYKQFLAALFLAGVRNVNPRPPGFALHCVFVIHSAHQLSLEAPPDARALPLFYALDNFKTAQERDSKSKTGDYTMRAISGKLPSADRAPSELAAALTAWDGERAERAVAALARHRSPADVFAPLWTFGARDYRNIGHKAIFAANAYRTLEVIGWQHAEPVLRSLAAGLTDFGPESKLNGFAFDDQCIHANTKRAAETRLPDSWTAMPSDAAAVRSVLEVMRTATPDAACADVAARLSKAQCGAAAVWDAIHLASAELRLRSNSRMVIGGIHAVSSANALRYAFTAATDPRTRLLLTLQGVGWMGQFRQWGDETPGGMRKLPITDLEPASDGSVSDVLAAIPGKLDSAGAGAMRAARDLTARQALLSGLVRLNIAKADEVHYYKYLAALLEDIGQVSPEWQPHLCAAAVYYAKGPADPDPEPMQRARAALAKA